MTRLEVNHSLYIVAGWFWDSRTEDGSGRYLFGGDFELKGQRLEGRLSDDCGTSRITGVMTPTVLEFKKTYNPNGHRKKLTYNYKFEKKSGIWVGGWHWNEIETTYVDTNPSLQARCRTLCVWDTYLAMNALIRR